MNCGGQVTEHDNHCSHEQGLRSPTSRKTRIYGEEAPKLDESDPLLNSTPEKGAVNDEEIRPQLNETDHHENKDTDDDCRSMTPSEEGLMEHKQFREVCLAFSTYEQMAMEEVDRMRKNFETLNERERALLCQDVTSRINDIVEAIQLNQVFLDMVVSQSSDLVDNEGMFEENLGCQKPGETPLEPGCAIEDTEVSSMNMYKVRSTLKQFVREWSQERAEERESAFGPLIASLHKYIPLSQFQEKHGRLPWVLCPGSGLGRLPFDVVCNGYCCQGNEFSYFMLMGSNFILNHALAKQSIALKPFALNSSNRRNHSDHLQTFSIPDVLASDAVSDAVKFSMCAGDFVEVYSNQKESWDAVLTCFFLDTAKNIITYIHLIANMLPPGGLWSNIGPLLYHFADSATEISIELSWEETRSIIAVYFDIQEERWVDCFYTTPPRSMLQALYHCIYFSAIRNDVPLDPAALKNRRHNSPIRR